MSNPATPGGNDMDDKAERWFAAQYDRTTDFMGELLPIADTLPSKGQHHVMLPGGGASPIFALACSSCGALVLSRVLHERWHEGTREAIINAAATAALAAAHVNVTPEQGAELAAGMRQRMQDSANAQFAEAVARRDSDSAEKDAR